MARSFPRLRCGLLWRRRPRHRPARRAGRTADPASHRSARRPTERARCGLRRLQRPRQGRGRWPRPQAARAHLPLLGSPAHRPGEARTARGRAAQVHDEEALARRHHGPRSPRISVPVRAAGGRCVGSRSRPPPMPSRRFSLGTASAHRERVLRRSDSSTSPSRRQPERRSAGPPLATPKPSFRDEHVHAAQATVRSTPLCASPRRALSAAAPRQAGLPPAARCPA